MARRQVNILMTEEERDVLEALAFIEETTVSELLRPVVASYLTRQRNDPDVAAALAALNTRRARKDGKLSKLRERLGTESGLDS